MLKKLKQLWNDHGFELILVLALVFLLIYALYRIGKKGSYSNSYYLLGEKRSSRGPPKESKGEKRCRNILQSIFQRPFPKVRPDFLCNPVTGGNFNLEIDCYCDELKLGCEYNGQQHYKYTPFFHKNKEAFYNQKYRDQMTRDKCKQNGIRLIEVPYTVKYEEIEKYIRKELKRFGYNI